MLTISIISQKGGAGKTTLAVHLAAAALAAGKVSLIIDTDPQATASAWSGWRGGKEPEVIDCGAPTLLRKKLDQAASLGADVVIVDTPPHADAMARAAADVADLIIVPVRPRAFDLDAIQTTAALIASVRKPAFALFNGGPPSGKALYAEATEVVASFGLKPAPLYVADRAALHKAVGSGQVAGEIEPAGKAAEEIAALWRFICKQVNI
ncbi:MAG: AAA family ATPase [Rhodospirillaceae bacterium]